MVWVTEVTKKSAEQLQPNVLENRWNHYHFFDKKVVQQKENLDDIDAD